MMACNNHSGSRYSLRSYSPSAVLLAWTIFIGIMMAWDLYQVNQQSREAAVNASQTFFSTNYALRLWVARHGATNAAADERISVNPNPIHVADRNIEASARKILVQMPQDNGLRRSSQDLAELHEFTGHLTSLKPVRSENRPDDWERSAFRIFQSGAREVRQFTTVKAEPFLRLMRPLIAEANCLQCHAHQGYKIGDITGGISVSIPLTSYLAHARKYIVRHMLTIGIFWILGMGAIRFVYGYIRRCSRERESANDDLREKERYFRSLISNMHEDIMVIDRYYKIADVNNSFLVTGGHAREEVVGRYCYEISHGYDKPCHKYGEICVLRNVFETGQPDSCLHEHKGVDGSKAWVDILLSPLADQAGNITHVIESSRCITDLVRTKMKLETSERRYRTLIETMREGVGIEDEKNLIAYANESLCQILGYPANEIIGKSLADFCANSNQPLTEIKNSQTYGESESIESIFFRKDGQKVQTILSRKKIIDNTKGASSVDSFVVITDISKIKHAEQEKSKLQAMLHQSQKMDAIGTLAGGIAHDFNNILAAILGYAEMAQLDIPSDKPIAECLAHIVQASRRAKGLVKQILAFSRQNEQERKPIKLHLVIREVLKLIRACIPANIEIRQDIASNAGLIIADPTQIHQVLMNLCTNAYQAMRDQGGTLKVTLTATEFDDQEFSVHDDFKPNRYLQLTVADTGCGIKPAVIDKIFEPFFSTKPSGEGSGMGLAVVYGIVKSHGGAVKVCSEPGKGSAFHLFFPVARDRIPAPTEIKKPLPIGSERILFIDDEKPLVDIGQLMLSRLGYDVTTRTSSIEALALFKAQGHKYDLVITDMNMPNLTGERLAAELLKIRPDTPIILCTGYSEALAAENVEKLGIKALLMKPIARNDLANTIREVLDRK